MSEGGEGVRVLFAFLTFSSGGLGFAARGRVPTFP